ncbi:hypothetical protein ODZ84_06250 [Chryseobacterium fluminis]|uniref:hypothetical protein n=1 Tax=Chryseobacterium fluminis TaxID=2983606 RepID=UPI0022573253|nr:hypothetical protein [Chryseobacterium sp. MMS21-Ot14]UZT99169.1 hypothetical protein ODZ84_06250 [Chryseobacterium sp. MMS21-Ot14]
MTGKQTMFFAVFEDLERILRDFETNFDIKYYYDSPFLLEEKNVPAYNSIFETANVGIALSGNWNKIDRYLVMKKNTLLNIREIPQLKGGVKFTFDQKNNPLSIEIKFGGVYSENVIVAGRVATISKENDSQEMYKFFSSKIKKIFKKIGMFYVGPKAEERLREGWRLVQDVNRSTEYDLTLKG